MRKDRRGTAIRDWRRLEVWHRLHFCWIRDRAATSRLYVIALSFIVNCPTDGQLANLRFTKRCPILNVCKFRGGGLTIFFFVSIYKINFGPTLTLLCGLTTCNKEKKLCYLHFSTEWNWIHKIFGKAKMMIFSVFTNSFFRENNCNQEVSAKSYIFRENRSSKCTVLPDL